MHALGGALVVVMTVAAGTASESCLLGTKTNFCEQWGLICKPGQKCAADEPVCIPIGGCGDRMLENGEVCDDGNLLDGDGCSADCKSDETCGNGIVDVHALIPEACDHGTRNGLPDDSCDSNCHFKAMFCGNGILDLGEECDPGEMDSSNCNSRQANAIQIGLGCKSSRCGDGYTNVAAGEMCDSGGIPTAGCNGNPCTLPVCGDNIHNQAAGEDCDNGSADTIGCNGNHNGSFRPGNCKFPSCGDGYVNAVFKPPGASRPEECEVDVPCQNNKTCDKCNCI